MNSYWIFLYVGDIDYYSVIFGNIDDGIWVYVIYSCNVYRIVVMCKFFCYNLCL